MNHITVTTKPPQPIYQSLSFQVFIFIMSGLYLIIFPVMRLCYIEYLGTCTD